MHDPVVCDQDPGDGGEPDGVPVHEIEKRVGGCEDVPRGHTPCAEDGTCVLAAADVDVLWT